MAAAGPPNVFGVEPADSYHPIYSQQERVSYTSTYLWAVVMAK